MDRRSRERTAGLAAPEASLARREQLVAAREQELRAGRTPRPMWWALRLAPLTAIELVVSAAIFIAAFALTGTWLMTAAVVGAVVIAISSVARLIGVQRPR
jgi:hypothetical protein